MICIFASSLSIYSTKVELFNLFVEISSPCERVADLNSQDDIDKDILDMEFRDEVIFLELHVILNFENYQMLCVHT